MLQANPRINARRPALRTPVRAAPRPVAQLADSPAPRAPRVPSAVPQVVLRGAQLVTLEATPELDFESAESTRMFDTLSRIRAHQSPARPGAALATQSLADARGYRREDLFALAEIGYHYLLSGGVRIAETIFAGLTATAPREAYFALALGLCHDRQGRAAEAASCYRAALALDPKDARAELNLAELALAAGERREAAQLLRSALTRLKAHPAPAIERKARALLAAAVC